jgi:endonuclease/exonuclease/phosphatase family metal-dependent hydrolase
MVVLSDSSGKMVGWSDPESFPMPSAAAAAPAADLSIPSKAQGSVRVVSYNVLKSALNESPQSFARVFQVLDPDIIVIQEWDADAATAGSWFTGQVSGERSWNARSAGSGVVIVSPHPMKPLGPNALSLAGAAQQTQVRFIGSVVTTPAGDVAVGSVHLKCCGTAGSSEDQRRLAEAKLINSAFKSALSEGGPAMRVIAGDCNLVGTYGPLEALMAGLDSDGSDLSPATPVVLGDSATYTWSDPKSEFPPGRLDYALFGDASADVVQAFVLDTSRLSTRSLARVGLDRTDTAASDHLPVVVDLRPR